jgi:hypothetical protein
MRDAHLTTGKKRYVEDLDDAIALLKRLYPAARREGSIGAWSWAVRPDQHGPDRPVADGLGPLGGPEGGLHVLLVR